MTSQNFTSILWDVDPSEQIGKTWMKNIFGETAGRGGNPEGLGTHVTLIFKLHSYGSSHESAFYLKAT